MDLNDHGVFLLKLYFLSSVSYIYVVTNFNKSDVHFKAISEFR